MALAAEVHLAEGQLQHFKPTLNKVKSLRSQLAHEDQQFLKGQEKIVNCCRH
jgi:hypothetical protein